MSRREESSIEPIEDHDDRRGGLVVVVPQGPLGEAAPMSTYFRCPDPESHLNLFEACVE